LKSLKLEIGVRTRYIRVMAHVFPASSPSKTVRDTRSGRLVQVHGLGALRGKLPLRPDVDLTKPIFEQVSKARPKPNRASHD